MSRIKMLFLTMLVSGFTNTFCQDYDLIVTINGDSIACHIDSITTYALLFEMKFSNHWIHTQINKSEVREYNFSAISKKTAKFKPGTSQLDSKMQVETNQSIRKNSIYVENLVILPSISYDTFLFFKMIKLVLF